MNLRHKRVAHSVDAQGTAVDTTEQPTGLRDRRHPVDALFMDTNQGIANGGEKWLDGYRAAIEDAVAVVESLGGPSFGTFTAPVLLRLKARLLQLAAPALDEAA